MIDIYPLKTAQPSRKRPHLWLLVVLPAMLLVIAFLWMDFRVALSETRAEHQFDKYTLGSLSKEPPSRIQLHVADGAYGDTLRDALASRLRGDAAIERVDIIGSPETLARAAVLVIEPTSESTFWTPIVASGSWAVHVVYASDGDLSWQHQLPIEMRRPAVWARGDFQVIDVTWGIISWRAYQRHRGEQIAAEVYQAIESQVLRPTGS